MHIFCVMLGCGLGGLEQSLIDYSKALTSKGHKVTAFIRKSAQIDEDISHLAQNNSNIFVERISNFGQWDIFAKQKFKKSIIKKNPDAIICFGNRAISMAKPAAKGIVPVIARTPNYSVKRMIGLEAIFHTTEDLRNHIASMGQDEDSLHHIPNMIDSSVVKSSGFKGYNNPPVIGTMGRFVQKKGFDTFIEALKRLQDDGIDFKAVIGGDGSEKNNLIKHVKNYNLEDKVEFAGWIHDKDAFFGSVDIFCLPSLIEPFGIVLLEAFLRGKPVITSNAEGPSEIATDGHDALIFTKGNADQLHLKIKELLLNKELAECLSINAKKTIKQKYDIDIVGELMDKALKKIVS